MSRAFVLLRGLIVPLALLCTAATAATPTLAPPSPRFRLERIVMVYRHGLRAPLTTEIGAKAFSPQPWPTWSTPDGELTPHGREGMRLLGVYDRALFARLGLYDGRHCPTPDDIVLRTDSDERTIASGAELAEGLAPGCQTPVRHLPDNAPDPLFSADAPGAAPFDPALARQSIEAYDGGPAAQVTRHRDDIGALETILGCGTPAGKGCGIGDRPTTLGGDGDGLHLGGPIAITSGTGEVLLLEYVEHMPMADVGWGRTTPARLAAVSRLHGLLFDVYDRPAYMARRTAAALAPRLRALLVQSQGPKIQMFVGHDNNIAALAALIGAAIDMPSYGAGDPPIGGALGFELLVDRRTGERFVRTFYQAQTLDQLRDLTPLSLATPPATVILSPSCAAGPADLCRLDAIERLLTWPGQRPSSPGENE